MLKQYDFVNEMHSIGNKNCEHTIVPASLTVQQEDPTRQHVHKMANLIKRVQQCPKYQTHLNLISINETYKINTNMT